MHFYFLSFLFLIYTNISNDSHLWRLYQILRSFENNRVRQQTPPVFVSEWLIVFIRNTLINKKHFREIVKKGVNQNYIRSLFHTFPYRAFSMTWYCVRGSNLSKINSNLCWNGWCRLLILKIVAKEILISSLNHNYFLILVFPFKVTIWIPIAFQSEDVHVRNVQPIFSIS